MRNTVLSSHSANVEPRIDLDGAKNQSFKDWSPWLFLDRAELQAVSQRSCTDYENVSEFTPFLEYGRSLKEDMPMEYTDVV